MDPNKGTPAPASIVRTPRSGKGIVGGAIQTTWTPGLCRVTKRRSKDGRSRSGLASFMSFVPKLTRTTVGLNAAKAAGNPGLAAH